MEVIMQLELTEELTITERNTMSKKSPERRRYDQELTLHHRKPRNCGGKNDKRNLSWIPRQAHQSWHNCFGTHSAQTICFMINQKYLDPDYEFICVKKE